MNLVSRTARRHRRGFTLIELLVVIAIIAILAALLFPVMAVVRAKTSQSACASQIADVIRGIKMYKDDWRVYPDAIYGIQYPTGTFETRLYPDYVKDERVFVCPYSPVKLKQAGAAVTVVTPINPMTGAQTTYGLANFSSYDFQYRPMTAAGAQELHYNRRWTAGLPSLVDDPRQLLYRNPPDDTVVTWCLYHSDLQTNGMPSANRMAVVGFLSGRVQTIPADKLAGMGATTWQASCTGGSPPNGCPWQTTPKP